MDTHHERVLALKAGIEAKIKAYDDENQDRLEKMDKKLCLIDAKLQNNNQVEKI